ncbi:MAG: tetratricopeptide repeat protein [Thermoplasmatota archaeon]
MGILKDELILYSISLLEDDDRPSIKVDKSTFSSVLNIAESTLNVYLSHLRRSGDIERIKKKHSRDIRETVRITHAGKKRTDIILQKIDREMFTPERHNLPTCISVTTVLDRINDPLEKIFSLSLYNMSKRFDFNLLIQTMRTAKVDSSVVNVISNITEKTKENRENLMETFFRCSYIGNVFTDKIDDVEVDRDDPDMMLLMAEAACKQCRVEESKSLYEYILSPKMHLSDTQWFIASCGLALVTSKMGDIEGSIEMFEDIRNRTDNSVLKAYTRERTARILTTTGDYEGAEELFRSCIASYRSFGIPILQAMGHNNYGILLFCRGDLERAEKEWISARKHARESGSRYLEGPALGNLASIEREKGNLDECEKLLSRYKDCFKNVYDIEGESYLNFNYSLLYLARGDREKALEYFHRFSTIAYPSPSPLEREIMLNVFLENAEKNDLGDILSDETDIPD